MPDKGHGIAALADPTKALDVSDGSVINCIYIYSGTGDWFVATPVSGFTDILEDIMPVTLNPQYVVDNKKIPKAILLSIDEWEQIVKELEELEDIRAYDAAKAGPQDSLPFEQAISEILEKGKD